MENIKVQYSDNSISRSSNAPTTITNVAQVNITRSIFSNNNYHLYNYPDGHGGVFSVRNSSMEIFGSIFLNNYAQFSGGVIYDNNNSLRGSYQNRITIANSTFTNNRANIMEELYKCNIRFRYGIVTALYSVYQTVHFLETELRIMEAIYYDANEEVGIKSSMFTNSYANDHHGGTLYSRSSVTVTHCNITGNTARQQGGTIYSRSRLTCEHRTFLKIQLQMVELCSSMETLFYKL